jgi:periplasmic protein TonB
MLSGLEQIIFEQRNKEYGAYRLRNGYARVMANALLFSCLVFTLIWLSFLAYYYYHEEKSNIQDLTATYEILSIYTGDELEPPPTQPDLPHADQDMLPKPEITAEPEVVDSRQPDLPIVKSDNKAVDDTIKKGDRLATKGTPNDGADTGVIYIRVEKLPEYPGGRTAMDKFLRDNIKYPSVALVKKLAGVVYISFLVNHEGKVDKVKIIKSLDVTLDNEAMRVIRLMPRWVPGKRHGKAVNVMLTLPIRFIAPA